MLHWPTEQIPGSNFEKISLDKDITILQHMLDILRTVDDNTRWKRRHRDLKSAEADFSSTITEPVKQLVPWLQEPQPVARNW